LKNGLFFSDNAAAVLKCKDEGAVNRLDKVVGKHQEEGLKARSEPAQSYFITFTSAISV
jgi:hypothetical protein